MLRFVLALSLTTALWLDARASAQLLPAASLAGRVTDAEQRPLRDAEARLLDAASGQTLIARTDLAGEFAFNDLPSGRYVLSVFKDGYAARRLPERELLPDSPSRR